MKRKLQIGPSERPDETGGSSVGPFDEPVIQDPFCAWYERHEMECPPLPGGGGGTGGGGGRHSGDWDCFVCTARYTACFTSGSISWYPGCFTACTIRYIDCTQEYCDN